MNDLLFTYYGDDFTGSTDALEVLTTAGLKTVLFTEHPTSATLARYPGVQAVGLAGIARSLAPTEMATELRPAFAALRALRPRHLHYKVCSTFDSSPGFGSIGRAIEIGLEFSSAAYVPLLVGNPALGRYCVFGHLFAQAGVGHEGIVYRLDRHPTASRHPVTPMLESDLSLHLARQTKKRIALFDVLKLSLSREEQCAHLRQLVENGAEIVLFDALSDEHMSALGALIDESVPAEETLFSVGSSGVELALGAYWQSTGQLSVVKSWPNPGPAAPLLIVSGSCSPVSDAQIGWALAHGFAEIALETCVLTDEDCNSYLLQVATKVVNLVSSGKSVVVHTSRGTSDPRFVTTARELAARKVSSGENQPWCARRLGVALGHLISEVLEQTSVKRICIAGGDTSSYTARALGVAALEMICPTAPGAPLCRASAPGRAVDGTELCFKGGQVGKEDFFGSLLRGFAGSTR